jgi:hypothetical protein
LPSLARALTASPVLWYRGRAVINDINTVPIER